MWTWILLPSIVAFGLIASSVSFTTSPKQCKRVAKGTGASTTALNGIFDDVVRKFFQPNEDGDSNANDNNLPAGTCRVATIPVKSIKPGGLRLFLMFYLMGMQNTPDRNSWRADQPTTEEYVIDFWFHDQSAVLSIQLDEHEIAINRVGSAPSTAYMMQETVVLSGILDELSECAFSEEVAEEKRLLVLKEPKDAIEKAKDALAFA